MRKLVDWGAFFILSTLVMKFAVGWRKGVDILWAPGLRGNDMKKLFISTIALAAVVSAVSAFAADLPSRKAPPYIPPPPPPLWTGFYVGLNAGGTFGGNNRHLRLDWFDFLAIPAPRFSPARLLLRLGWRDWQSSRLQHRRLHWWWPDRL